MSNDTVVNLKQPEEFSSDPLTEYLRQSARDLLANAVGLEVSRLLAEHEDNLLPDGRRAVIRNGYLPERAVQTGIGDVSVKIPKIRDRSGDGIKFNSKLIPPYLKRSTNMEEFIPYLYLRGVSTGDFESCLSVLFGTQATKISAGTVSELKRKWEYEHDTWQNVTCLLSNTSIFGPMGSIQRCALIQINNACSSSLAY